MSQSVTSRPRLRATALACLAIAALIVPATAVGAKPDVPGQTTAIRILDVSDWHGQLDPSGGIGGAEALSSYLDAERAGNANNITLTGGDDFGASPPLASFFDEEPAVLAERLMGIDVSTLGNHNFDKGIDHLQEMIDIAGSTTAAGEPYEYVSANLQNRDAELTGVEDYKIFKFAGVKVAVIGITNPEAPGLVFPGNFGSIVPTDPVAAAMRAQAAARAEGAKVFIALTHLGVEGSANGQAFGPLIDFANAVSGFTVIYGDHTNVQYADTIKGQLVVENLSKGASYSRTDIVVRRGVGQLVSRTNTFVTPTAAGRTDPQIAAMLQPYRDELRPILSVQLGSSTVPIPRADACGRSDGRLCESKIGNVVTDAMRARYDADFAITNAGGLRADLTCPTTDVSTDFCPTFTPPPYPITRGQTFGVLPFGNFAVTVQVSGTELKSMLENGVSSMPGANGRFAQVSGLCFTYDVSAAVGSRVTGAVRQAADGSCSGASVSFASTAVYLVAMNDFMATGGDGYPRFATSRINSDGTTLEQVLADYIVAEGSISPAVQGRVTCTTSGSAVCPTVAP